MKNKRKHRRILILMITSQLLLTTFVVYWLNSQFRSEKERLKKELMLFYIDTEDELIDTLIFKSYINPVLSANEIYLRRDSSSKTDTSECFSQVIKKGHSDSPGTGVITVKVRQNTDIAKRHHDTVIVRGMSGDMLARSVRLFVAHVSDSAGMGEKYITGTGFSLDTAAFRDNLYGRMKGAGMNFGFRWNEEVPDTQAFHQKRMIFIKPFPGSGLPGASVSRYHRYIFINMWPQIAFGTVLVLLTAMAFLLSYRSIRDHMVINNLRNEFIGNITHELKTPVATLSVVLESLGKFSMKDDPRLVDEYLKLASLETKSLVELMNSVLDHSLLEDNSQPLMLAEVNLNAMITEVADIMRQRITTGSILFYSKEEQMTVMGDPLFLKGVIVNLIDNSIKY